jgi:hypothetical protein
MGGGAWPFLVGGVIRLLNCDNERDLLGCVGGRRGAILALRTTPTIGVSFD